MFDCLEVILLPSNHINTCRRKRRPLRFCLGRIQSPTPQFALCPLTTSIPRYPHFSHPPPGPLLTPNNNHSLNQPNEKQSHNAVGTRRSNNINEKISGRATLIPEYIYVGRFSSMDTNTNRGKGPVFFFFFFCIVGISFSFFLFFPRFKLSYFSLWYRIG